MNAIRQPRADFRCVVLPKLSKMLNQEVALGAPWLLGRHPPSAGASMLGKA